MNETEERVIKDEKSCCKQDGKNCHEKKHHSCNHGSEQKDHCDKKHKEIHKLKEENDKLKQEIEQLSEKIKYHQAELINYRKRKEEETANMLKYANQGIIQELILVLDNFERAIKLDDNNLSDELSKFLDGFKMMYVHLSDILKRFGVEEIECEGKEFDPNMEEALMVDEDKNYQDNIVLEVLLKGYKLKDRVIRPAAVKVNKLKEKEEMKNE